MIVEQFIDTIVTANARGAIKDEIIVRLQEVGLGQVPVPNIGKSVGNWTLSLNNKDLRPDSELTFDIVDEMLKDGMPIFCMLMKLAQVMTVFRTWRGWKVVSPDEELAEVATANLRQVLPQMMVEGGYRSMADGAAFMELLWENKTKRQLGMTGAGSRGPERLWTVARRPHLVDPRTISHIIRPKPSFRYSGFVQMPPSQLARNMVNQTRGITIWAEESLILPYNSHFRNLWGKSFLEPLYPYWFWFMITLRSMVRAGEKLGLHDLLAKAPIYDTLPHPTTSGATIGAMEYMGNVAASLAYSNWAVLPSDYDPGTNTPKYDLGYMQNNIRIDAFVGILQELAQLMLRAALSADRALTQSSGGVGSYNIGELHAAATAMHNQMILTTWMWYINQYFMPLFSLYNRGLNGPPIWLEVQAIDPEYRKILQTLLGTMGNSPAGQEANWMIDTRTLFELSSVPVRTEEEIKAMKKEAEEEAARKQERFIEQQHQQALARQRANGNNQNGNNQQSDDDEDQPTQAEMAYDEVMRTLGNGGYIPIMVTREQLEKLEV